MAENWIKLYEMVNGMKCSRAEDDRKFKAFAGCAPEVAEYIFLKYSDGVNFKDRWNLLIVLYYLKNNPTEDEGARVFQIGSRNTYRKYLWDLIYYLDFKMNEIDIESRFDGPIAESGIFANVTLVVDGTDCPIYRPTEKSDRLLYSSGRKKENTYSKYNIKYTIGVQVGNGRICCVLGPEPGSVSDITAIRNGEIIATITSWDPFEVVLADKGYQGLDSCLSPIKGTLLFIISRFLNCIFLSFGSFHSFSLSYLEAYFFILLFEIYFSSIYFKGLVFSVYSQF